MGKKKCTAIAALRTTAAAFWALAIAALMLIEMWGVALAISVTR